MEDHLRWKTTFDGRRTSRPGNNSGLSGILGFGSEIFCENAVVATQEIVIVHCESLESELLAEKNWGESVVYF